MWYSSFSFRLTFCHEFCRTVNPEIHSETLEVYTYIPQRNLIKAYATTSNLGSYERTTDKNGIYMKHLKTQLGLDLPIREILDRVMEGKLLLQYYGIIVLCCIIKLTPTTFFLPFWNDCERRSLHLKFLDKPVVISP